MQLVGPYGTRASDSGARAEKPRLVCQATSKQKGPETHTHETPTQGKLALSGPHGIGMHAAIPVLNVAHFRHDSKVTKILRHQQKDEQINAKTEIGTLAAPKTDLLKTGKDENMVGSSP